LIHQLTGVVTYKTLLRAAQTATALKWFKIIQSDSREEVNILGGDGIDHCEKKVHMNIYLILYGY
jgi:hypothetical protein